jgi:undecaprenyl-diphosphatase
MEPAREGAPMSQPPMSPLEALVLGLIQGLTEFLPISSTAHLKIVPALLGWPDRGAAFTAVIQGGTLLAVLLYFRRDIAGLTAGFLTGLYQRRPMGNPEARMAWMIVAGTLPIVVCGLAFKDQIETTLRSLYVMSGALIAVALLMALAEDRVQRRRQARDLGKQMGDLGWGEVLVIGFAQALALVPGTSRSGVTITAGLFAGLTRETAARFSFLLSLPAVFAAGVLELYKEREGLLAVGPGNVLLATAVAAVSGYASIAFLLRFLQRRTMTAFVLYRLALGALLLFLLSTDRLAP